MRRGASVGRAFDNGREEVQESSGRRWALGGIAQRQHRARVVGPERLAQAPDRERRPGSAGASLQFGSQRGKLVAVERMTG